MLSQLKGNNTKGFTLIELMIVIAIIGILAAIAIPNFIEYRNKSFCSAAESDANSVAGALADYFAIPQFTDVPTAAADTSFYDLSRPGNEDAGVQMSNENTLEIDGNTDPNDGITIFIDETETGRCPDDYQQASDYWTDNVYTKLMK